MELERKGILYVVSTPIGNLKDITLRALEILKEVDLIAAEDTRHSRKLTSHYDIDTPLTSYFEHNKFSKGRIIIDRLLKGENVALITDAGTPGISDPGYRLIQMAIQEEITIEVVPGACALIAGLVVSGKPTDQFIFAGFLPVKSGGRKKRLEELKIIQKTIVVYESPYRVLKTLIAIEEVFGDIEVVVTRELTKKFEQTLRKQVSELILHFQTHTPKGEFVIII